MADNEIRRGAAPTRAPCSAKAAEAADAVARQEPTGDALKRIGEALRRLLSAGRHHLRPRQLGSRGHFRQICDRNAHRHSGRLGGPVCRVRLRIVAAAEGALCIAISQSGRSPDLLATVDEPEGSGAWVLALVNDAASPLADLADEVFGLAAGPERSVAATKSFIASLAAIARVVAEWRDDEALRGDLRQLPDLLKRHGNSTGRRWRTDLRARAISMSLAADWPSASRRRPHSSSRKRHSFTPRRSAPPSFATGRWRSSGRAFRL